MSDAVQKLIDYCLKACSTEMGDDSYVALFNGPDFRRLVRAAQEQLTQQAENVSKPEITNVDESKTLRDEMAMAALTRFLWERSTGIKDLADKCYEYADAMLEARRQK